MSSDNGIYILVTQALFGGLPAGREYRVAHALGIENIYYDVGTDERRTGFVPEEAFHYFGDCQAHTTEWAALACAHRLAEQHPILEYGVSFLFHPDQVFQTFTRAELVAHDAVVEVILKERREKRERELEAKREAANIRLPAGAKISPGFCHGVLFVTPEGEEIRGTLQLPEITLQEDTDFLPNGWDRKEE